LSRPKPTRVAVPIEEECVMDFEDLWSWIPGMARPLAAGGEDGLQKWRIKVKVKVKFTLK